MFNVGRFLCIPFTFGACPLAADLVGVFVVLRVEFALLDSAFVYGSLHGFPLFLCDFHLLQAHRIIDVTVHHPRVHCHAAVCLERTIDAAYHSGFGVERAGATTLHAATSDCYQQHFSTSSARHISDRLSPMVSISDARISAS